MDYLKTTNNMQQEDLNWWQSALSWLNDNWFYLGLIWLGNQALDKFFSWLTKRSEARIKEIMDDKINESVTPKIESLTHSIDELRDSIWALKNKL